MTSQNNDQTQASQEISNQETHRKSSMGDQTNLKVSKLILFRLPFMNSCLSIPKYLIE